MKYLFYLILILFVSSCNNSPIEKYQVSKHEIIADKITAAIARKIEAETGLLLAGTGGGMMDHVKMMAMSFDHTGELTIEQGRALLIYCVNEYLSAINQNEEIRPYLAHYLFTSNDIEISIFIIKSDKQRVPIGALSVINAAKDSLRYRIRESDPVILKLIHEETYEQALEILQKEGSFGKLRKNSYPSVRI